MSGVLAPQKNMTSLLRRHDLTTSLGLYGHTVHLNHTCFFRYNVKTRFSLAETVFACMCARCSFAHETVKSRESWVNKKWLHDFFPGTPCGIQEKNVNWKKS